MCQKLSFPLCGVHVSHATTPPCTPASSKCTDESLQQVLVSLQSQVQYCSVATRRSNAGKAFVAHSMVLTAAATDPNHVALSPPQLVCSSPAWHPVPHQKRTPQNVPARPAADALPPTRSHSGCGTWSAIGRGRCPSTCPVRAAPLPTREPAGEGTESD